jgi:uncharacterized protein (DUF2147 family)
MRRVRLFYENGIFLAYYLHFPLEISTNSKLILPMKKILFLLAISLFVFTGLYAQSPVGVWETIDDETGLHKSDVEVFESNGKLYGKILALYNRAPEDDKVCTKCTGDMKNKPLIGLQILKDLEKDGNEWNDGDITDPKNGKTYSCYITLEDQNKLKVRGFIGFSLLGRTQYWYRKGTR